MNWIKLLVLKSFMGALVVAFSINGSQAADKAEKKEPTKVEAKKDEAKPENKGSTKQITGAGATFPYPLYAKWASAYKEKTGIELNYQSIGSGGGIKQIKAGTVHFGASDKPLKKDELDKDDLIQFPAIMGGVVIVVNLEGVKDRINLTAQNVSDIYKGKIKKWTDEAIKKENPKITFPDKNITVVHRADGSGTTFLFTTYLSENDDFWKTGEMKPGTEIKWPTGLGGKGNEGVAANVKQTANSIGYVEFAYAKQNNISWTTLTNKDGKVVEPSIQTFTAAGANAKWDEKNGYYLVITNQPGAESWPIAGASFILLKKGKEGNKGVTDFFKWCLDNGQKMSTDLDYVHLPKTLIEKLEGDVLK